MKFTLIFLSMLLPCICAEDARPNVFMWRVETPKKHTSQDNNVGPSYVHFFADHQMQLTKAVLCDDGGIMESLSLLSNLPKLKHLLLKLSEEFHLSEEATRMLKEIAGLEELSFSGKDGQMSKTYWVGLCEHKRLQTVICTINDKDCPVDSIRSFISASPDIRKINILFRFFNRSGSEGNDVLGLLKKQMALELDELANRYTVQIQMEEGSFKKEFSLSISSKE